MAGLSRQQQLFVAFYCETWNATEAARRAGYSERSIRSIASENLTKPNIRAAIEEHVAAIMPAGEVLQRLADQARSTMADFIDPDTETLDLQKAYNAKKLHLIRKFTRVETEQSTRVSIDLYDAQAALELLGKHHGLFKDIIDVRFNPGDLREDQLRRIAAGEPVEAVLRDG
jgi:phage terminase small subunit